jgi:hypothetical protein
MTHEDILAKLEEVAALKPGDPVPEWLPPNEWGVALSALAAAAADLLKDWHSRLYEERDRA